MGFYNIYKANHFLKKQVWFCYAGEGNNIQYTKIEFMDYSRKHTSSTVNYTCTFVCVLLLLLFLIFGSWKQVVI